MNAKSFNFDPEALGRKYQEERDKRVRVDGNDQYQEVTGEFAYFVEDPYIGSELKRDAIEEEVEVVIIGGGFGGMLAAARLREAGIDDFRIIEKGGDFGGTWYWNRYPGARCDIESMDYSYSFSEELQQEWNWKEKYGTQPELLNYAKHVCEKFNLRKKINFNKKIIKAVFNKKTEKWIVSSDDNIHIEFYFGHWKFINTKHS